MSKEKAKQLTIALAGNPNSGKTTTFNNLTGTRQKVGNWAGVTVEKKLGQVKHRGYDLTVVDLPGTYSLTAFSIEEVVARNFVLDEKPDLVVDVIDASNLERSLYLATQLRELDVPVLFVLNMMDVAKSRGLSIDTEILSSLLDVPVVTTVGNRNQGTESLLDSILDWALSGRPAPEKRRVRYTHDLETAIAQVREVLSQSVGPDFPYNLRWTSVKLIENDSVVRESVAKKLGDAAAPVFEKADKCREKVASLYDDEPEIIMTEERYGFIAGIVKEVVKSRAMDRVDVSRSIDRVLTNRFLGFPLFLFFIWGMFQLTFTLGAFPMEWIDSGVNVLAAFLTRVLPTGLFADLMVNGILAGIGSVLVFLPNILILFLCIAIFEDTGYMARAAFLMDRIMHLVGLHGKSFIPLLMGFGCNVPAIMATRTLESEKDRILTILINPLMSCSARLPVYVLLAGTFFAGKAGNVIFAIYLLGIVLAVAMGRLFRGTILKGEVAPFVMELPPYRMPMVKSLMIHMWDRSKMFLKKMGGVILVGSMVIWALSAFPRGEEISAQYQTGIDAAKEAYAARIDQAPAAAREILVEQRDQAVAALERKRDEKITANSWLGRLGRALEPVFAPLHFDWKAGVSLVSGLVAKEVVVSTLAVLHSSGDPEGGPDLGRELKASGMTPLIAFAMMAFVLLYVPCLATVAAIRQETGSWKWAGFSMAYSTALAWVVAFVIVQGGRLIGLG